MNEIKRKMKKGMKKRVGRIWRDRSGVSPIIAIILMVVAAIVFAVTIYMWIGGFVEDEVEMPDIMCLVNNKYNEMVFDADEGIRWVDISIKANRSCDGRIILYAGWIKENTTHRINTTFKAIGDIWVQVNPTDEIEFGNTIILSGVMGKVEITLRYDPEDAILGSWVVDV